MQVAPQKIIMNDLAWIIGVVRRNCRNHGKRTQELVSIGSADGIMLKKNTEAIIIFTRAFLIA